MIEGGDVKVNRVVVDNHGYYCTRVEHVVYVNGSGWLRGVVT